MGGHRNPEVRPRTEARRISKTHLLDTHNNGTVRPELHFYAAPFQ